MPDEVADAVARALRETGGNLGAPYATGERIAGLYARAEDDAARLLGCDSQEVMFGANMTSLNFMLSRTVGRDLREGDEILVSRLDHDAGVAPWRELAADRGLVVRQVDVHDDLTLDLDDLEAKLSDRTRVVAFAWAANSVGTVTDAERVCALAHEAGALAWVDAVHFAAHGAVDVRAIDADVLLCSACKFCGPRLGIGFGRTRLLERLRPYYALGLRDRLPYPDQALRVGFAHYTTAEEVDRLVAELTAAGREASAGVT